MIVDLKGTLEDRWRQVADCVIGLGERVEVLEERLNAAESRADAQGRVLHTINAALYRGDKAEVETPDQSSRYLDARVNLIEQELAKVDGSLGERLNLLWAQQPKVVERFIELEKKIAVSIQTAQPHPNAGAQITNQISRATDPPPKCLECQKKGVQINAQAALINGLRAGIRKLQELLP